MTVAVAPPRLAPGVELLGPYRDSGLEIAPYLVRRAGRILQISRLLYAVAAGADGVRSCDEVAAVASRELDRVLTGGQVRDLVLNKLAPAGILTAGILTAGIVTAGVLPADGTAPAPAPAPAADGRLLGLRFRRAVVAPAGVAAWARPFRPLFLPPVVAGVLAAMAGLDLWLFGAHGVGGALDDVVGHPGAMVLVLALVWISGAFHELGHAAGCCASGGRPGAAGVGIYLWWPVLYTNVTDAYRLDRRGRLRTDLGGIYFNVIFTLGLGAAYAATGYEPLLAVIVLEHVLVLYQFIPWVRLDGFYIVSDLTGVPDILSRVRPALRSLIPGRPPHPAVAALRPAARRLLFAYLGSLVLFVTLVAVPAVLRVPGLVAASWDAILPHLHAIPARAGQWDTPMVVVETVAIAVLAIPIVGLALTAGLIGGRLMRRPARWVARTRPAAAVVEIVTNLKNAANRHECHKVVQ